MEEKESEILKNHPLIKLLKYGAAHEDFTTDELVDQGIITSYQLTNFMNSGRIFFRVKRDGPKYILSNEAVFSYLQYIEFQEARKSARKASTLAWAAIIVSGILALCSIGLSLYQMFWYPQEVVVIEDRARIKQTVPDIDL